MPVFTFTADDLNGSGWVASTSGAGGFTFKYPSGWRAQYDRSNIYGFDSSQVTMSLGYNKTIFIEWGEVLSGKKKTLEDELGGSQAKAIINGISYPATFSQPSNMASSSPQLSSIFVRKNQSDLEYVRISGQGIDNQTLIDAVAGFSFVN